MRVSGSIVLINIPCAFPDFVAECAYSFNFTKQNRGTITKRALLYFVFQFYSQKTKQLLILQVRKSLLENNDTHVCTTKVVRPKSLHPG